MKRTRKQRGLTLIELGTSVAVIAVSLLGTAAAVATSAHVEDSTAQTQTAKRGIASLMDDIRSTDFAALVDTYDDTAHDLHGFGADGDAGSASVRITEVNNNSNDWTVYRVSVSATFPGSGDAEAREIVTYISDRRRGSALGGAATATGTADTGGETTTAGTPDTGDTGGDTGNTGVDDGQAATDPPPADPPPGNGNGNGNGNGKGKGKNK